MAPKAMRSDDDMEAEDALIEAVAAAMIELDAASTVDDVDEAEKTFQRNVAAIEKRFQKGKQRGAEATTTGGLVARGQRYRDMVTARTSSRKRELKQTHRVASEEREPRQSRRAGTEESSGTGQFVGRLAEELRSEAELAGISWDTVLDESDLSKASRSRVNHGKAGLTTLERVRTTLERLRGHTPSDRAHTPRLGQHRTDGLRWVVVERSQGGMFAGRTNTPDTEVAERGYVRLHHCRSIRGEAEASELANWGPGPRVEVSEPTSSVLVIGVANVYDCSPQAAQAFQTGSSLRGSSE